MGGGSDIFIGRMIIKCAGDRPRFPLKPELRKPYLPKVGRLINRRRKSVIESRKMDDKNKCQTDISYEMGKGGCVEGRRRNYSYLALVRGLEHIRALFMEPIGAKSGL